MFDVLSLLALAPGPMAVQLPQPQPGAYLAPLHAARATNSTAPPVGADTSPIAVDRDRLYFDQPGGSTRWVRGRSYKASAGPDGFTFVPFLGSEAPRNFPVRFELNRAAVGGEPLELEPGGAADLDANRFILDRGAVEVRYDLTTDSVEQSFAVDVAGADGDLELVIDVRTELQGEPEAGGFRFMGPAGGVTYGSATVVDGAGRFLSIPADLRASAAGTPGSELTLTVPASFLQSAQGLVVVDPVIATYGVSSVLGDQRDVDMAYDESSDRFVYIFEEQFSGSDVDLVVMMRRASDGALQGSSYFDMSSDPWENPSIASANGPNKCLIAAEVDTAFNRTAIHGRFYSPGTGALEPAFSINSGGFSDKHRPDVGGNPTNDPSGGFMAVWEAFFPSSGLTMILGRTVSPTGGLGTVNVLRQATSGRSADLPAISKSMGPIGAPGSWVLAYRVKGGSFEDVEWQSINSAGDSAGVNRIFFSGGADAPVTSVDVSDPIDFQGSLDHLVCVGQVDTGRHFISLHRRGPFGSPFEFRDMSFSEHSPMNHPRYEPHVATESGRFLISYLEGTGNDFNAYLSILDPVVDAFFGYSERRTRLGYMGQTFHPGGGVAMATKHSGGDASSRQSGLCWESSLSGHVDLIGVTHEAPIEQTLGLPFCHGFPNSTGTRGFLSATGDPSLTSPKRVVASSLPPGMLGIFVVSDRFAPGIGLFSLPNGVCVGGSIERILSSIGPVDPAGTISLVVDPTAIPSPTGPIAAMPFDNFVFQFWHRDVVGGAATSNFTNATQLYFF